MILLFLQNEIAERAAQLNGGPSVALLFLQLLVALGFVVGLAYLILRVLLPRTMQRMNVTRLQQSASTLGMMRLVDTLALKERQQVHIIEIAGRYFAIATMETNAATIAELRAAPVEELEEQFHKYAAASAHTKAPEHWLQKLQQFFRK